MTISLWAKLEELAARQEFVGMSTDNKPTDVFLQSLYKELDTQDQYIFTDYGWLLTSDKVSNKVWDSDLLSWVAMTQPLLKTDELTVSGSMAVTNFPTTQPVSGIFYLGTQPVSGEVAVTDYDPTAKYKITDIDPTDGNSYYGYTDKDGGWYIKHVTATEVRYVKGNSGYAEAWVLRADPGTVYYYFYEVFS